MNSAVSKHSKRPIVQKMYLLNWRRNIVMIMGMLLMRACI
jgi:hypothetical protein